MSDASGTSSIEKVDAVTFDGLLRDQDPFGAGEGRFDLRGVRLITPAGLIQLAAALYALETAGARPTLIVDDDAVRSYLVRVGFTAVVQPICRIEPPVPPYSTAEYLYGSSPMLIEVTRLENGKSLPELLDKIVWVLRYRLKYRKYDAFDIATAVSEICQNTFDHNDHTCGLSRAEQN